MKIIYDISSKDVCRMDSIVLSESEFPTKASKWRLAFRGDDRAPADIFKSGFTKRTPKYTARGASVLSCSVLASLSWDEILGQKEWGPAQLKSRATTVRNAAYTLLGDEVLFRPNHLDLEKETCISMTLDFELAAGFPLVEKSMDTWGTTYSYIVLLPTLVLPTHLVQLDGGNTALAKSLEVTCNAVPQQRIVGAAEFTRKATGSQAMSRVEYKVVKWWANLDGTAHHDTTGYVLKLLESLRGKVSLEGTKLVSAGVKVGDTASNNVLRRAVEALNKHVQIEGGLTGGPPKLEVKLSKTLDALF